MRKGFPEKGKLKPRPEHRKGTGEDSQQRKPHKQRDSAMKTK